MIMVFGPESFSTELNKYVENSVGVHFWLTFKLIKHVYWFTSDTVKSLKNARFKKISETVKGEYDSRFSDVLENLRRSSKTVENIELLLENPF